MKQFPILLRKDFLELLRTRRILIVGIIFIAFAISSPLLAKLMPELLKSLGDGIQIIVPEATIADSYSQFMKNISQICVYALIIAFGGLIVSERRSGMFNNLLNNGVKKSAFVLSKITAQILVVTGVYIMSVLLFNIYNQIFFGEFWLQDSLLSFTMMYIFLLFAISFINLFSVVSKSVIMSIIFGFLTIFAISLFDLFQFGKYLPNYLITMSATVFTDPAVMKYVWWNMAITLALSGGMILAAIGLCKNKE
jgi:ABC-2 type transport system permease protein